MTRTHITVRTTHGVAHKGPSKQNLLEDASEEPERDRVMLSAINNEPPLRSSPTLKQRRTRRHEWRHLWRQGSAIIAGCSSRKRDTHQGMTSTGNGTWDNRATAASILSQALLSLSLCMGEASVQGQHVTTTRKGRKRGERIEQNSRNVRNKSVIRTEREVNQGTLAPWTQRKTSTRTPCLQRRKLEGL